MFSIIEQLERTMGTDIIDPVLFCRDTTDTSIDVYKNTIIQIKEIIELLLWGYRKNKKILTLNITHARRYRVFFLGETDVKIYRLYHL